MFFSILFSYSVFILLGLTFEAQEGSVAHEALRLSNFFEFLSAYSLTYLVIKRLVFRADPSKKSLEYKILTVIHKSAFGILDDIITLLGEEGVISFFAAGNENNNIDNQSYFPAGGNSPYKVTVGASGINGERACFSNYGRAKVDLFAPGVDILSTVGYANYFPNIDPAETRSENTAYYGLFDGNTVIENNIKVNQETAYSPITMDNKTFLFVNAEYTSSAEGGYSEQHRFLAYMDYTAQKPAWSFRELSDYREQFGLAYYSNPLPFAMNGKIYLIDEITGEDPADGGGNLFLYNTGTNEIEPLYYSNYGYKPDSLTLYSAVETKDGIYYIEKTDDGKMEMFNLYLLPADSGAYTPGYSDIILGDADGDGKVSIKDVTAVQRHVAEFENVANEKAADVNRDGVITIDDATIIQRYLAEMDVPVGIGQPV